MKVFVLSFLLVCLLSGSSWAFTTTSPRSGSSSCAVNPNNAKQQRQRRRQALHSSSKNEDEEHPAVVGWPEKYVTEGGAEETKDESRVISETFEVHAGTDSEKKDLDVEHWPTWTTGDKPKWDVGNQIVDKEMPYGELSYMIQGKLEIIPKSTGVPVVVAPGDLVTFPKGFVASWQVLEELTWHYYLY